MMAKVFGTIIGTLAGIFVIVLLLTLPTLWCWNYAMPNIFSLPKITFWQAFCLVVLANCLIKSTTTSK